MQNAKNADVDGMHESAKHMMREALEILDEIDPETAALLSQALDAADKGLNVQGMSGGVKQRRQDLWTV